MAGLADSGDAARERGQDAYAALFSLPHSSYRYSYFYFYSYPRSFAVRPGEASA